MVLKGLYMGEYQGNKYARIICTEPMPLKTGCMGENAIISKVHYDYANQEIAPKFALLYDKEIFVHYDRYGKVCGIGLIDPVTSD